MKLDDYEVQDEFPNCDSSHTFWITKDIQTKVMLNI